MNRRSFIAAALAAIFTACSAWLRPKQDFHAELAELIADDMKKRGRAMHTAIEANLEWEKEWDRIRNNQYPVRVPEEWTKAMIDASKPPEEKWFKIS